MNVEKIYTENTFNFGELLLESCIENMLDNYLNNLYNCIEINLATELNEEVA